MVARRLHHTSGEWHGLFGNLWELNERKRKYAKRNSVEFVRGERKPLCMPDTSPAQNESCVQ